MDIPGLVNNITNAAIYIDFGRKGFATRGKEQEGRILYENGIALALSSFKEASNQGFAATADPQVLLLAEYTFITQEFQLADKSDKDSIDSLSKAIESFDDAFLSLKALGESDCKSVDSFFPHNGKYRVHGFPKDSYHIACIAHRTRLQNILRAPGIDPIEKALLKQRLANLAAAQSGYVEKQKNALV